jgi:hypothetical protein
MDGAPSKSIEDEPSEISVEIEESLKEAHDDRAPPPAEEVIVQEEKGEEYVQRGTTALDEEREAKEKESNSPGIKPGSEKETIKTSKIRSKKKKKKKPNKQRRDEADAQRIRLRTKPPRAEGEKEQKSQRDEERNREGVKSELDSKMELGELSLQGGADTGDIGSSEPQVRSCVQCLSNHRPLRERERTTAILI